MDVALGQDFPLVDENDDQGQGFDLGQDVARDKDRPPFRPVFSTRRMTFLEGCSSGIEAVERLVQDENLGLMGQRLADFQPLAHPPAVAADEPVGVGLKLDEGQGPGGPFPDLGR